MKRLLAALPLAAYLAGCTVGPDYVRPGAPMSATFKEDRGWKIGEPRDAIDRGAWWSVYNDSELDRLEQQIAISNQTLKQAEAAYREAQALVREARAGLFPTVTLDPGVTRGGGSSGSSSFGRAPRTSYTLEGSASWDLDVWGRIRRTVESDVANAQASAADIANARLSAEGALAVDYFDLQAADELERLLQDTAAAYRRSLRITQNQYDAGVAARSDVITAQAQVLSTEAQAVNAGVARAQYEHAIAVLIGKPPADLTIPQKRLSGIVPVAPVSVPSALLERRPDIAAAERAMQQQNALIGAAVAAWYPAITLSALAGFASPTLGSLLNASNTLWSLGAAGGETLFDGGLRSGQVAAARATYDQSVASYRQTVLSAFQGVEDQLAALRILEQEASVQAQAVAAAQQAVQIALNEYRAGTVTYTTVVTAQALLLSDQQAALTIQQDRLVASATLIQDLGGGWDVSQLPAASALRTQGPILP